MAGHLRLLLPAVVAHPLFTVRRRVILCADNPETLIARMDAAEQKLRIRPPID
jgi:hypothetical protein